MDFIPQYVFNGLVVGCSYALIAVGLTAIFGLMEIAKLCPRAVHMLGAYFTYWLTRTVGLDFWIGLVVSVIGVMLVGVILERTFIPHPARRFALKQRARDHRPLHPA